MKIHEIPIMVLIIGLVIMGAVTYISDLGENYDETADFSTINKTTANMEKMKNASDNMKQEIDDFIPEEGSGVLLMPYKFLTTAWASAVYMYRSFTTFGAVVSDVGNAASEVGVSSEISSQVLMVVLSILTITVIAIIVYAFFKWKFED